VAFGDVPLRSIRRSHVGATPFRVTRQLPWAKPADIETGKGLVEAAGGIRVMVRASKYEAERTIYPPDQLVAILSEHLRQHTRKANRPGDCDRWRATRSDAGVGHKLHDLRHYFASGL
jgi:hypothetical protein